MKTFAEKERYCEMTFASGGPYWHAYTNGKDTPLIFAGVADFTLVMNVIAQASAAHRKVIIIAFEIMGNHLHLVLSGTESEILAFWQFICRRLAHTFTLMRGLKLSLKPIEDLNSLRCNIVYTHRNGYVVNPDCTPFSYPWGSGRYYFQNIPCNKTCSEMKIRDLRQMFRGRAPELPADWKIIDGHVSPASFCAVRFGMAMFRDAHQYFSMLGKNIESYSEIAVELDDSEFLTDPELIAQISKMLPDTFGVEKLSALSKAQKLDLARTLHYKWRSSNGQIRRVLGLSAYEVDSLFPLSGSKKSGQL